jgi:toxin ParE1/3/4
LTVATYKLRPKARDDLRSIRSWIAKDTPVRARSFVVELATHFQKLAALEIKHQPVPELGPDMRKAVHGNYDIYYRLNDDGVLIVRVLHSARSRDGRDFG